MSKSRIEDEAAARRLARAIGSDIALYNDDKMRKGQSIAAEITEGRDLFRTRVAEQHFRVYETEIERLLGPRIAAGQMNAEPVDFRTAPGPRWTPDPQAEPSPWAGRVLWISLTIVLVCAGTWFALHR